MSPLIFLLFFCKICSKTGITFGFFCLSIYISSNVHLSIALIHELLSRRIWAWEAYWIVIDAKIDFMIFDFMLWKCAFNIHWDWILSLTWLFKSIMTTCLLKRSQRLFSFWFSHFEIFFFPILKICKWQVSVEKFVN